MLVDSHVNRDGARRALDALARRSTTCCYVTVGTRRSSAGSWPAAACTAVPTARPATSATSAWPATTTSCARAGNTGCLEAVAGGEALWCRTCRGAGLPARSVRDVVAHARAGEPCRATGGPAARVASRGRGAGGVHQLLQPGRDRRRRRPRRGAASSCSPGSREAAIGRSLPMATRDLRMVRGRGWAPCAALIGTAVMVDRARARARERRLARSLQPVRAHWAPPPHARTLDVCGGGAAARDCPLGEESRFRR